LFVFHFSPYCYDIPTRLEASRFKPTVGLCSLGSDDDVEPMAYEFVRGFVWPTVTIDEEIFFAVRIFCFGIGLAFTSFDKPALTRLLFTSFELGDY